MAEVKGSRINTKKRAKNKTSRESQQDIPEYSDPLIPKSSHELEGQRPNRDYDSLIDKGTNGAGKVEPKKLEYTLKETDDEREQGFSDWGMQVSQDELKTRFRDAVKRSTLRKIESLVIKNEQLNCEVRRLRGTMNDVQVLLEKVESGGLDVRDKDTWLEACRNLLKSSSAQPFK
ncbi:3e1c56e7-0199-46ee-84ef-8adbc93063be-CDS [Sclerotinia trifoliorum]|uniref:3e1c56e7-0199-46ee-84ef-8adbc93063be-CDS n=1 Tax=Sclerotinia trifoliorum TaxID=28548 RepID=A0A8H2ZRM2_9HELO|nr:3e1c56e7-0199-46ee-84ef-8adbc93063be-CDS [Sclerotinia trifoliorum]